MTMKRRDFLASSAAAAAVAGLGIGPVEAQAKAPVLGLIFPPLNRGVPDEGFDAVIERVPAAAKKLADAGAEAIELTGTSLTFYQGEAFNQKLRQIVVEASGLPATTMSNGVVEGLKEVGAKRVAVATAYNDVVNERLRAFLIEHGLEPVVVTGMGIEAIADVDKVTQNDLLEFGARVRESARGADAMLLSCGGFRTLELIAPLEARTGVPVISSMPHGLWAGARLVGMSGAAPGYGKLLAQHA